MSNKVKLIIAVVLVVLGLRMCNGCGGGNSISSIAGTYTLKTGRMQDLEMEVLEDGRVRFAQHMSTKVGRVTEVVNGVFVVKIDGGMALDIRTNTGSREMGWGPLIFDTNDNLMYWGYNDYENRDITKVDVAKFN